MKKIKKVVLGKVENKRNHQADKIRGVNVLGIGGEDLGRRGEKEG